MASTSPNHVGRILILGATGFVGRRVLQALALRGVPLRILVRSWSKARAVIPDDADVDVVKGDVLDRESLHLALRGVQVAYYLIHSMGGRSLLTNSQYARTDSRAARRFMEVAEETSLARVIYLGALGETGSALSPHLRSRAEVAAILASGAPAATILRAAIIIGAGCSSFEMLRYLVERLPVMACPKWIDTRIQPIAIDDVVAYLVGCLDHPETAGLSFDIGGPEVLTYREMMHAYAEARGLARRVIFRMPLLTPLISVYWVDLVTPVPSGIAHPLIEGLKNEVVCKDDAIDAYIPIARTPFAKAVQKACREETSGPGVRK
jgi:uncharacterized protein YbjT (DUF2867 family)